MRITNCEEIYMLLKQDKNSKNFKSVVGEVCDIYKMLVDYFL